MEIKTGIIFVGAFALGAVSGAVTSYYITKQYCDQLTQQAIDEMKVAHKKELNDIKETKNEPEKTDETRKEAEDEDNYIRKDKPSITEMSSIVNSNTNDNTKRTQYNFSSIKKAIQELDKKEAPVETESKSEQTVIDYNTYVQLTNQEYFEKNFTFNVDDETWKDWDSDVQYDPTDLPFDPDIIQWNDDEQCYICDRSNHSLYVLEKV